MIAIDGATKSNVSDIASAQLGKDGHVLIRNVADANAVADYARSIRDAVHRLSKEHRSLSERSTYDKAFLQVTNLWRHDSGVKHFVFEKKFAQIAADLLGVEKVRLYHDQALFKEPGGGHTPWHQDKYYWPLDTGKMITMWMPLVDINDEMGIIAFASGSHTTGLIDNVEISNNSDAIYERYVAEKAFPIAKASSMKAGDATFHLGWTIHSAGPNTSETMREVMTVIYFADGTRVTEPINKHQQADLDAWLPGLKPGDLADSDLNPILN
jgi:ectoine hydroxylase-related dioxygenase (phytanoyl-CoA dioxygenase family)